MGTMTRGPNKGNGGRPTLPPGERRDYRIQVGVNDAEIAVLELVRNDGEPQAACVRRLALESAHGTRLYHGLEPDMGWPVIDVELPSGYAMETETHWLLWLPDGAVVGLCRTGDKVELVEIGDDIHEPPEKLGPWS